MFDTSEWLTIIGIIVAIILGLIPLLKKSEKSNNINISQTSAPFSKGKQKQNVKVNIDD